MRITHLGHSSFKITGKGQTDEKVTVITDPFDPKVVGIHYPKQEADIVTSSHEGHGDHDWYEGIKGKAGEDYFLINTPGEYEINGLRVFGIKSFHDDKKGEERGPNTIYIYDFEEARIAHLGDLGHPLDSSQLETLESIDILMIPVGGIYTIDPKTATQIIENVEPKAVIPMHYKTSGMKEKSWEGLSTFDDFAKESGLSVENVDTLKLNLSSELGNTIKIYKFAKMM